MMSDYQLAESDDPDSLADLEELASRIRNHSIPENPVIFYGSSSFRLWDPTIRSDLNSDSIVNLAFGGSTLNTCCRYFDKIMKPYRAPKSMVIYAGDNDLGQGKSAVAVRGDFLRILNKVESRFVGVPVFFLSIKPSPSKQSIFDVIVDANRYIQDESARRENLHYIDIFTPMLTRSGQSNPAYFLEDMLHMNESGYEVWRKVILNRREQIGL